MTYKFTKHEGLGNDFLVLLDPDGGQKVIPELVQQVCDRRRGVGADGLIRAVPPDGSDSAAADAVMELYNADGSRAEMSGNGIRCLVQALLLDGWAAPPEVVVATDAGPRTVTVIENPGADVASAGPADVGVLGNRSGGAEHWFSVDMGTIEIDDAPAWALGPAYRAARADAGNPHVVLELSGATSVERIDLEGQGERINAEVPGGANVHVVGPGPGPHEITLRTYERGVGLTDACGTGASVAAVAAARWKVVEPEDGGTVQVVMPGGAAQIVVGGPVTTGTYSAVLIGPARSIAAVELPWPQGS